MNGRDHKVVIGTLATLAVAFAPLQVSAQKGSSCPLTEAQSSKAVAAWAKISAFIVNEPRCVNCHGRVNPYIDGVGLDPADPNAPASEVQHGGGREPHEHNVNPADGTAEMDRGCKDCHSNMAPGRDSNWTLAPSFLSFPHKDAITLCRQIKRSTGTADGFMRHLQNDDGGTNFAGTAFLGTRGLDADQYLDKDNPAYIAPAPPSITHDAFIQIGRDWIDAMGGKFQGDESCGCELKLPRWSGQISYWGPRTRVETHNELNDVSSALQDTVMIDVQDGTANYHGHVERTVQAQGRVRVSDGGRAYHLQKISAETMDGNADGDRRVKLGIAVDDAHRTYSIWIAGFVGPSGAPMPPPIIGKSHQSSCGLNDGKWVCFPREDDVYMPSLHLTGPLSGNMQDPNNIHTSVDIPGGGTIMVTLARSGSPNHSKTSK